MPASKRLSAYTDVHQVFDAVIAADNQGELDFPTPGKATNFAQRCNSYRKLLHEKQAELLPPNSITQCPYDHLVVQAKGNTVTFTVRHAEGLTLRTPDGEVEVDTRPAPGFAAPDPTFLKEDQDDLIEDANNLANRIANGEALNLED